MPPLLLLPLVGWGWWWVGLVPPPPEWTLLGRPAAHRGTARIETSVADKLRSITDARSLKLFVWKVREKVRDEGERRR